MSELPFERLSSLLTRLNELAASMKGQDNACTVDPIFVVQQRRRIRGMDASYSDLFEWIHFEGQVADAEEKEEIEEWTKQAVAEQVKKLMGQMNLETIAKAEIHRIAMASGGYNGLSVLVANEIAKKFAITVKP